MVSKRSFADVRKACGEVAGHGDDWCEDHLTFRHWGSDPCGVQHPAEMVEQTSGGRPPWTGLTGD